MLDAVASSLPLATGGLALWQLSLRWRGHGITEVRHLACQMRTVFEDASALGGVPVTTFMSGENRKLEADLTDLRDQLRDPELARRVERLLGRWTQAFAAAPSPASMHPSPVATVTPEQQLILRRHLDAAADGLRDVQRVLDRCNHLTRWIVGG